LCLTHEGTWVRAPDCYLEDLFVDASARGKGVGRALLDDLVALCKARGWTRLYWHTEETNATARKLYDSYVESDGHIRYRISF
jgi:GNAT superfamily N-acetyltransferase